MSDSISSEIWRLLAFIAIVVLAGTLLGYPLEALTLTLGAGLAYQLFRLKQLRRWLHDPNGSPPPDDIGGIWGGLYHRIYQPRRSMQERERQLRAQLDQLRRSSEAMPDAVVSLSRSFEIRWLNDAAGRLLGLKGYQDVGQPIGNLLRSPLFQSYLQHRQFRSSLEMKAPGNDQLRISVRIVPYGEQEYLLLAQDITERHRLERVRKDFVANVSHELRTPLTVISGFVENLQHDESGCAEKWRRPLELMGQQTSRMRRIVEDLLLLATLEATTGEEATREPVDVPSMLEEIAEETLASLSPDDQRTLHVETAAAWLSGNTHQLRSAFANLVTNAAKYTPVGGRIEVRWRVDGEGRGVVEVEDTGEGIAAEHIPRLTERFYRVDAGRSRAKGGTGLGLAIVKHVLQKHGARLSIDSELGKGSCFRCIFPTDRLLQRTDDAAADEPADEASGGAGHRT